MRSLKSSLETLEIGGNLQPHAQTAGSLYLLEVAGAARTYPSVLVCLSGGLLLRPTKECKEPRTPKKASLEKLSLIMIQHPMSNYNRSEIHDIVWESQNANYKTTPTHESSVLYKTSKDKQDGTMATLWARLNW